MDAQRQVEKPVVSNLRQIASLEDTFPNERWTLALKDNVIATEKRALLEIINATINSLNTEKKSIGANAFFQKIGFKSRK